MSSVNHILKEVTINVERLINKHEMVVSETQVVKDENAVLKELVQTQEQHIADLTEQNKVLQMAKTLAGTEVAATTDVRKKINELVREIDKCIALLNR